MSANANALDEEFSETIDSLFGDADSVLFVNPAPDVFRTVMMSAAAFEEELPTLQVLATPDVLKSAVDDFILASHIAELVDQGRLELRTTTDITRSSLLISDDQIITVITLDDELTGLRSMDDELVTNARTTFDNDWESGEEFSLRTPPISRVRETLADELGEGVEDDFMMIFESVDRIPGEGDELDAVAIALLVGAHNEVLLYDISKWGEDTGVASKATFSRTKTRLEDRGMIETEKVPIDVGRPRLRLVLVPDDLEDIDSLAEQVTA